MIIKISFYYFGWLGYPLEPSIKIQEFFLHILEILEIENLKKKFTLLGSKNQNFCDFTFNYLY